MHKDKKISDFTLVPHFFSTPRTILEISVNQENFLWGSGGRGMGVKLPKTVSNAHSKPKYFLMENPLPLARGYIL